MGTIATTARSNIPSTSDATLRSIRILAGAAAGAAVAHVIPAASWIPLVRRNLIPRLHGIGRPGHLALTFDDGPDPKSTDKILQALDRHQWKATFFMLGLMADRHPSLAAEVAAAGHEVALHGYSHVNHLMRSPLGVLDDLRRGFEAVSQATGAVPVYFRPPYGIVSSGTLLAAGLLGLRPVLWSAWGKDWTDASTGETVMAELQRGLAQLPSGAGPTVLLHDSDATTEIAAWHATIEAVDMLADLAEERGWQVGTLRDHWKDR